MAVYLAPGPFGAGYQAFDSNGIPLNGGFINTYAAGTTTSQATFTTVAGTVTNANPIQLSTDGRPQNAGNLVEVWLTSGIAYKFQIVDSLSNQIAVYDNLTGINDIGSQPEWIQAATPTFVSALQFTVSGNQTSAFDVGRRVKAVVTSGTIYGTISAVSFSTNTTVTVDWDSTQLDAGLSAISYALLDAAHPSIPTIMMDQPVETVTAAGTIDLGTIRARNVNIVGSTTITRLSIPDGQVRFLTFNNQVTLSNTVSQILSVAAGSTITTLTGDSAIVRGEPGLARFLGYQRANGAPVSVATQAQQETATTTAAAVTPGTQQFHPSAAKGWAQITITGTTPSAYNVTSIVDNAAGDETVNWTVAFSSANYCPIACCIVDATLISRISFTTFAAGTTRIRIVDAAGTSTDPNFTTVAAFGDQ